MVTYLTSGITHDVLGLALADAVFFTVGYTQIAMVLMLALTRISKGRVEIPWWMQVAYCVLIYTYGFGMIYIPGLRLSVAAGDDYGAKLVLLVDLIVCVAKLTGCVVMTYVIFYVQHKSYKERLWDRSIVVYPRMSS